jgi:hypothetical protein
LEANYTKIVIKKFEKQYKNLDIVWIKELKRFALIEYRFSKIVLHLKEKVDHKWAGKFLTLKLSKASYSSLLRQLSSIANPNINYQKCKQLLDEAHSSIGVAGHGKTTFLSNNLQAGDFYVA